MAPGNPNHKYNRLHQDANAELKPTQGVTPSASMSSTTSTTSSASTTINRSETQQTLSPAEVSYSVPTSPTSLSTPLLDACKKKELASSVPTSPESAQMDLHRRSNSSSQQNGVQVRKNDAAGFRTSRSEDHLQNSQREGMGAIIPIDIDEDVNSSLNTLLDTRHDSEDSQVCNFFDAKSV